MGYCLRDKYYRWAMPCSRRVQQTTLNPCFRRRLNVVLLTLFFFTLLFTSHAQQSRDAFYWNSMIGKGINLGNALEAPKEGDWSIVLEEEYFALIARVGFDSVRIPIRWSTHAEKNPPYTIHPEFFKRVDWAIKQAHKHNLLAIINIHHFIEFLKAHQTHKKRFFAFWKQIAERYRNYPDQLFFEVCNEPRCEPKLWNRIQNETISLIRKSNPQRAILVAPTGFNSISHLNDLKLPVGDSNLIVSIHYYHPMPFTHQGAKWTKKFFSTGVLWKGTQKEKYAVIEHFNEAFRWAKKNKFPLHLGEFGAYQKADMASRVRWTSYVRSEAEKRNMSWSYWEFCAVFGVYDPKKKVWHHELLKALLPQ